MKRSKRISARFRKLLSLGALIVAVPVANAEDSPFETYDLSWPDLKALDGVYLYGAAGKAKASNWCSGTSQCTDTVAGYGGGIGYKFVSPLEMEASYLASDTLSSIVGPFLVQADATFITLSLIASLYAAPEFALQARLGATHWDVRYSVRNPANQIVRSGSVTGYSPVFGAGVLIAPWKHINVRIEYQHIPNVGDSSITGQSDVDAVLASLIIRF